MHQGQELQSDRAGAGPWCEQPWNLLPDRMWQATAAATAPKYLTTDSASYRMMPLGSLCISLGVQSPHLSPLHTDRDIRLPDPRFGVLGREADRGRSGVVAYPRPAEETAFACSPGHSRPGLPGTPCPGEKRSCSGKVQAQYGHRGVSASVPLWEPDNPGGGREPALLAPATLSCPCPARTPAGLL